MRLLPSMFVAMAIVVCSGGPHDPVTGGTFIIAVIGATVTYLCTAGITDVKDH